MLTKNHAILEQEVAAHIAADQVAQGQYWSGGKGCFIGCLTHSSSPQPAVERFGLTLPILCIAEDIFEALSERDAKAFFADFPDAVACDGKDLSLVHWAFLAEELRALPKRPDDIQRFINPMIEGMDLLAAGSEWPGAARAADAARAARAAAHAAHAAVDAARAARAAARAADAAHAAVDAARAARAAARAADAAHAAVDARIRQRDTLLRLIKEAPIVGAAE